MWRRLRLESSHPGNEKRRIRFEHAELETGVTVFRHVQYLRSEPSPAQLPALSEMTAPATDNAQMKCWSREPIFPDAQARKCEAQFFEHNPGG
jgi:hypothetical protein